MSTVFQCAYWAYEQEENRINYALKGSTSADKSLIDHCGPDKLIDEIINHNAGAPAWISLDLKGAKCFAGILLAWENACVESFHIEVSDDGKNYEIIFTSTKETNYAPNSNPTYQIKTVDETYVDYNFNTSKGLDHSNNKYNLVKKIQLFYLLKYIDKD